MAVLINFKICDNSPECGGLAACPNGAIFWNKGKETLTIDNSKCVSCGLCVKGCELGAIKVARDDAEYQKIEKEIQEDPRKITDLFVDRYGAQPVLTTFLIEEKNFDPKKLRKLNAVELFNDDSIECLLKSIPINELLQGLEINYTRVKLSGYDLMEKYDIRKLPALLIFNGEKILGKVEGYFEAKQKEDFRSQIDSILEIQ